MALGHQLDTMLDELSDICGPCWEMISADRKHENIYVDRSKCIKNEFPSCAPLPDLHKAYLIVTVLASIVRINTPAKPMVACNYAQIVRVFYWCHLPEYR
jgi:hypothetical protein